MERTGRCPLCHREAGPLAEYCDYHSLALENLEASYGRWRDALEVDWAGFLSEVSEKPETGHWAKEVALMELKKITEQS